MAERSAVAAVQHDPDSEAASTGLRRTRHGSTTRSCQQCHQRKIRCDKKSPCSHCVRGNTFCHYPGPERRPRRPHKMTITNVAARVSYLEQTIASISRDGSPIIHGSTAGSNALSEQPETLLAGGTIMVEDDDTHTERDPSTGGTLVEDDSSCLYINEALLSRILDEERELQSVMGTPRSDITRTMSNTAFDIGTPFSDFRRPASGEHCKHPSRWQIIQLWRAFINNVDPVLKVLHLPTTEVSVFKAANDPTGNDHGHNALLFSIYLVATTSLAPSDVTAILGRPKQEALLEFKCGLEQSLAAANYLESPTMVTVQAMGMYVRCMRAYNFGRSVWTLSGLLMRSAESIGLHIDGTFLKLSPFRTEMRRRLWWFLCAAEGRAAEDHGISKLSYLSTPSQTQLPSNLDDSDLDPNMTTFPASKSRCTNMTFTLAVWEAALGIHQVYCPLGTFHPGRADAVPMTESLASFTAYLENKYLRYCNPDIPIQKATLILTHLLSLKYHTFITPRWLKASRSIAKTSTTTEEMLITAYQLLEMDIKLQTDDLLKDFRWILSTFTQYHPLLYVLWHLCVKPIGPSVQRAWSAAEETFRLAEARGLPVDGNSKWRVVKILRRRAAMRLRDSADTLQQTHGDIVPAPSEANDGELNEAVGVKFQDPPPWDLGITDFADWSNFVDNFDMYDFET